MPEPTPVTPQTLDQIGRQLVGIELTAAHLEAAAGLVNALAEDMRAFRQMPVEEREPATNYSAVEGQP